MINEKERGEEEIDEDIQLEKTEKKDSRRLEGRKSERKGNISKYTQLQKPLK